MPDRLLSQSTALAGALLGQGMVRRLTNKHKIVVCGHSFGALATKDQGTAYSTTAELDHQFNAHGIINVARFLSGGALSGAFALNDNYSVGNTPSPNHVKNQLAAVVAAKPTLLLWHAFTNDPLASNADGIAYTLQQSKDAAAAFAAALPNTLITVETVPPRANLTTAQRQAHSALDGFIRTLPQLYPNFTVLDYARYWVDHLSTAGDPIGGPSGSLTGSTYDGTHGTPKGAYPAGALLWELWRPYVGERWPCETVGVTNVYDPVLNPTGNLMASAADMLGTGGTFGSDTGISGTISSNYVIRAYSSGIPVTASKGAGTTRFGASPFVTQRLALGSPGGTGMKQVFLQGPQISVGAAGVSIGDKLGCAAFVRLNNVTGLFALQLGLAEYGASSTIQQNIDGFPCFVGGVYYPCGLPAGAEGILEIPPLTVSALVGTGVRMLVTAWVDAATCAADFEIGAPNIWKM